MEDITVITVGSWYTQAPCSALACTYMRACIAADADTDTDADTNTYTDADYRERFRCSSSLYLCITISRNTVQRYSYFFVLQQVLYGYIYIYIYIYIQLCTHIWTRLYKQMTIRPHVTARACVLLDKLTNLCLGLHQGRFAA